MFRGNINCRSAPTAGTAGAAGLIAAGTAALSERLGSTAGSSTGDVDCRLTKRRNILAAGYFRTGISQHFGIAVCVGHIAARHTGCKNRAVAAGKDHLRGHIVAAAAVHAETAERIAAVEDNRTVAAVQPSHIFHTRYVPAVPENRNCPGSWAWDTLHGGCCKAQCHPHNLRHSPDFHRNPDICRHTQYGGGHEISQAYRPARHVFLCRFPSFQSRTSRRQDAPPDTQFL